VINVVDVKQIDFKNKQVITKNKTNNKYFIAYDFKTKLWIAIDNSSSDLFVEDFIRLDDAIRWLRKYEWIISSYCNTIYFYAFSNYQNDN